MSLQINPDLGDSIVITRSGVKVTCTYQYKDTDFNGGLKGQFMAEFPRDWQELDDTTGELEQAVLTLSTLVARAKGIHS